VECCGCAGQWFVVGRGRVVGGSNCWNEGKIPCSQDVLVGAQVCEWVVVDGEVDDVFLDAPGQMREVVECSQCWGLLCAGIQGRVGHDSIRVGESMERAGAGVDRSGRVEGEN
jgi:hypothetical protein